MNQGLHSRMCLTARVAGERQVEAKIFPISRLLRDALQFCQQVVRTRKNLLERKLQGFAGAHAVRLMAAWSVIGAGSVEGKRYRE